MFYLDPLMKDTFYPHFLEEGRDPDSFLLLLEDEWEHIALMGLPRWSSTEATWFNPEASHLLLLPLARSRR